MVSGIIDSVRRACYVDVAAAPPDASSRLPQPTPEGFSYA
jgi:hypothetical protein